MYSGTFGDDWDWDQKEQRHMSERSWDEARLKRDRLARIQDQMREHDVGALYLNDGANVRYVMTTKVPGCQLFVPVDGEVVAFVRPRDTGYVVKKHAQVREPIYDAGSAWGAEAATDDGPARFAGALADLMAEHGVGGQRLGLDDGDLPAMRALSDAGTELVYAQPLIEYGRSVKTEDEIAIYRAIGDIYENAVTAFREAVRPGVTENELAGVVIGGWFEAGGKEVAQLNVCAGENMNPWLRWPTDRPLRGDEFVGLDLHGYGPAGLRGDASRTFFVGDAPAPGQAELYRQAYAYLRDTIELFRAGTSCGDVLANLPAVPSQYATQLFNYHVAHAIGVVPSGYPELDLRKPPIDDELQPNQVFAIECYFGEEGGDVAVKLEQMIVVTDGSPEIIGPDIPFDERLVA
jgi:Xaa-Pro aminopeptidase